jgi:periplasmic protein TonB
MPEFPGGIDSLSVFIDRHLDYTKLNQSINLEGRVVIRVIITKTGTIKDITVIRGLEPIPPKPQ